MKTTDVEKVNKKLQKRTLKEHTIVRITVIVAVVFIITVFGLLALTMKNTDKIPKVSETNSAADRVIIMDYPRVDKNIFTIELTSYDGSLGSTVHISRDELKRIKTRIDEVLK